MERPFYPSRGHKGRGKRRGKERRGREGRGRGGGKGWREEVEGEGLFEGM